MNVLHLVDEPYDSGIVHYAITAALGLAGRGHRVLFAGLPGAPPARLAAAAGLETAAVPRLPAGLASLRRLARERGVEVLVAHTGAAHALAIAATRALAGAPAVVRTRADARPLRRRPGGALLWGRTAAFAAASRRILSEFEAAYGGLGIPARAVLPGLPDPYMNGGPRAAAGGPPQEPAGTFRVGLLGRLDPVKGHKDFLRAAALVARRFPETVFLVAGREENVRAEDLRREAAHLGLSGRMELLGHVPDSAAFMASCHVGVVASSGSEAVSRAALEWMAAGRPLVATAVGGLPEAVADGETGTLVPPERPSALAEALGALLSDPALRRRMGRAARERFLKHFTQDRLAADTEELYEAALRGVPSR